MASKRSKILCAPTEATCSERSPRTALGSDSAFPCAASGCVICGFRTGASNQPRKPGELGAKSDTTFGPSPEFTCLHSKKSLRATPGQESGTLGEGDDACAWATCGTSSGGVTSDST